MYEGGFILSRIVKMSANFASEAKAAEVEAFHAAHPVAGTERTVKQTLESIRLNAQWLQRDEKNLLEWLAAQK